MLLGTYAGGTGYSVQTRINATLVWNTPALHLLKVGLLLSVKPDLLGLSHSDLANDYHLP